MCASIKQGVRWAVWACAFMLMTLPVAAGPDYSLGGNVYNFYNNSFSAISSDALAVDVADQFFVGVGLDASLYDASDALWYQNADRAYFTFYHVGPNAGRIAEIYWDWIDPAVVDGASLDFINAFSTSATTSWASGSSVHPGNLPGWAELEPVFGDTGGGTRELLAAADSGGGPPPRGINPGQHATFSMLFADGFDALDLLNSMTVEQPVYDEHGNLVTHAVDLRFGLHVTGIPTLPSGDTSYSFYSPGGPGGGGPLTSDPPVVPIPSAAGLGLLGMGLMGVYRRKKKGLRA